MLRTSAAAVSAAYPLLKTKLQVPKPRGAFIERPLLFARLDTGQPVTLVCAPSGSGKTTLLAHWVLRQGNTAAWLRLDELDNDLLRFLDYLCAAVRAPQATITAVLNALADSPRTLVLDDYQTISNAAIHDTLMFMIENLPPDSRLVIAGRTYPPLPLARLRVSGQLGQLDDLSFSLEESAAFLGLPPETETARALAERTAGWVGGLQMAVQWLKKSQDVRAFAGSTRYVYDYFMEEILAPQPAVLRNFLLRTAILDPLHADVCNALTGRQDSQMLLERLEQLNLFITPLDDSRHAFRYHPLFAEFLRAASHKLSGEQLPLDDLHLQASLAYERSGDLVQAADHALTAAAWERAASLVERCAARGMSVSDWMSRLPQDLLAKHPTLLEPLSERETEVLEMISTGMSNPEIARRLIIAVSTVKTHVKNIYRKLDVESRYEAMQRAREMDLLSIRLERDYRRLIQ